MTRRGGALTATLAFMLAAPLAAASSTSVFKGSVTADSDSRVSFVVVKNDAGKRRVDLPKARNLDAVCDSGPQEIDAAFGSLERVRVDRDGEFSFDNSGDGYIAYISGTITGKRAKGVLRFQGPTEFDEEPQLQTCDTGELEWSARKR